MFWTHRSRLLLRGQGRNYRSRIASNLYGESSIVPAAGVRSTDYLPAGPHVMPAVVSHGIN